MKVPLFYPILDTLVAAQRGAPLVSTAAAILNAGAQILQFRCKEHFSRTMFFDLQQIAGLCRSTGIPLIVNDRADIACLADAAGLHLGQDDLQPAYVRRITGQGIAIGFSTHNEIQLRAAASEPVDYLALGPIFGTASKTNPDPMVGLDELRRLRPLAGARPLVAIGGITRANARNVIDAGADSVAVISDLFPKNGDIGARVREWLQALS